MGCCLGRDRGGGDSPTPPPRSDDYPAPPPRRDGGGIRFWENVVRWRDLIALVLFRRYFDALVAEHAQPHWFDIDMWFWLYWSGQRDGAPFLPGYEV